MARSGGRGDSHQDKDERLKHSKHAHLECEDGESELKELPRNFLPTPGDLLGSCLFLNASVSLLKSSRSCLLRP